MIVDLISDCLPESLEADVCVVGSGPVGITLALALARGNVRVILLEFGRAQGRTCPPRSQSLHQRRAQSQRDSHRLVSSLRRQLKCVGGQILPFNPIDFVRREWVEGGGWPISFGDLKPYYDKALYFEGLGSCLTDDDDIWAAVGMKAPDFGASVGSRFSRWCPQPDFALLHGREIDRSSTLRCILHATVTALSCREDRIVAALARSLTGKSFRIHATHFVFCVGGIETARLLLQPLENRRRRPGHGAPTS